MFDKMIFPEKCLNNKAVPKIKVESLEEDIMSNNSDEHKLLKNWERPHYYHVACQDLIKEKLKLPKEKAQTFCLDC